MDMEPNVAEVAIFSSFWSLSLFVKLDDLRVEKLAAFREDVEEEEEGDDDDDDDEEEEEEESLLHPRRTRRRIGGSLQVHGPEPTMTMEQWQRDGVASCVRYGNTSSWFLVPLFRDAFGLPPRAHVDRFQRPDGWEDCVQMFRTLVTEDKITIDHPRVEFDRETGYIPARAQEDLMMFALESSNPLVRQLMLNIEIFVSATQAWYNYQPHNNSLHPRPISLLATPEALMR